MLFLSSQGGIFHHFLELFQRNLAVAVLVHLLDDLVNYRFRQLVLLGAQHVTDLVGRDHARAVLVEHFEGASNALVGHERLFVHGSDHEFSVVDVAIVVRVNSLEHLVNFCIANQLSVMRQIAFLDLFFGELAVRVLVELAEHSRQVLTLLLGDQLGANEGERGCLHRVVRVELGQVAQSILSRRGVGLRLGLGLDPAVVQGVLGADTL
jgi:hypothetical protein